VSVAGLADVGEQLGALEVDIVSLLTMHVKLPDFTELHRNLGREESSNIRTARDDSIFRRY
jgi:hypothetical protein